MGKRIVGVLLAALLAACSGCGVDSEKGILMAAGAYGDLAVVASDESLAPVARNFAGHFARPIKFVIKPEPDYKIDNFVPHSWQTAKNYKNSLFIVQTGQGGGVAKELKKRMTDASWERINSNQGGIIQLRDPWSTYQYAVVVGARDRNTLSSLLRRNEEQIHELFDENSRQRILRRYRYEGLNQAMMDACWRDYGFTMEIPGVFVQNQKEPDGYPGVEVMRTGPSQGISVVWKSCQNPAARIADRDWLLSIRTDMGDRLHHEDLVPQSMVWQEMAPGKFAAVKLRGAWTSRRFAGGGAFWSYFIPDPEGHRIFCVDLLVYAPGMDKMNFFRRMEAIASTFGTKRAHS